MDNIDLISHQFLIIVGINMYIFGLIGNFLNICVFARWCRPLRRSNENNNNSRASNSPLYLLTSSCANFIQIIYPLLTRIIYDGYKRPKTQDNVLITCKLRYYVLHTCDLISLTCICMATFDRYLITSRKVHLRRLSPTKQQTKLIILTIICIFGLHSIPIPIYYDVSEYGDCLIISDVYLYYYLYIFQIILHGIFPICFLSIFGGLTYKQLKMINRTNNQGNFHIDKQLSRMLLLLCIAILISSVPYCIQNIYSVMFTDLDEQLSSLNRLFYFISVMLFFTNGVLSFYIFFISTPNFRYELKKLFRYEGHHRNLRINQVNTIITTHPV